MLAYSQVSQNKFILRFGSLFIFSYTIFGFSNHVLAGEANRYQVNQNVSFQTRIDRTNKNDTHLKFGSRTIFIPDKTSSTNDNLSP